ncbi:hypothetical protein B5P44_00595 [Mycobacterium sp. CBMA 213]|uniref:Uncharacterized protein n=2 Tax=Mycolicibacterium sp. CBMA 213 TaxID=1968788 RepID=A0A343VRA2_9MYCO|nr:MULTISPECIES: hypothetical protein [unclassified Mycolicibacterium]AVN58426.1 hypothetical protein B5P44_p00131 [Mycolicibacterium sp. CBMA 213]MUL61084.1 hypothetical protein [Mycolicibacterium sp. CBMA 335]MUM03322.1 hypothetical protein [Mycolicibacterium sp. CBMA 213]
MSSEQWFHLADLFLAIALSIVTGLTAVGVGAFIVFSVINLIRRVKGRGKSGTALMIDPKHLRPRVWTRTTKMPLGSTRRKRDIGIQQSAEGRH